MLRHWREQQEANAEYFGWQLTETDFGFNHEKGTLPDPHWVTRVFYQIVKRAGLKHIRLHDLRHTCVTNLARSGKDNESL